MPKTSKLIGDKIPQTDELLSFLQNILEASTEISIIGCDLLGTISLWNEGAHRVYGYEAEEAIGQNLSFLSPSEDVKAGKPKAILDKALLHGKYEGNIARLRKNGEHFVARAVITPRLDSEQKPIGFLLMSKDISGENLLTGQLETARSFRDGLMEASLDPIATVNLEGKITDVNEAAVAMTGISKRQLIGAEFSKIFTEPALAKERFEQVFSRGSAHNFPLAVMNTSGKNTEVLVNASLFKDAEGKVLGVFAAARDIHEQKLAQEQEKKALSQLKHIFDSLDEVFFSFDNVNNQLLEISPACEKIYGHTQEEFLANPLLWFESIHVDDRPRIEREYAVVLGGLPNQWECRVVRADGGIRLIETKVKPALNLSGAVIRLDGIVTDITDRKRKEEELFRTENMATLGKLAAGVANDFNHTLSIMMSQGALLANGESAPNKPQEVSDVILQAAQRGVVLVRRLLAFAGSGGINFRHISINDVVKETMGLLKQVLPENISISWQPGTDIPLINADSLQLHQVLIDLCTNARDAMPKGGKLSIRISKAEGSAIREKFPSAEASQYVMVEVADGGEGMEESTRLRIFEPFFTTKSQTGGTGLGLATVLRIMQSHRGFVDFELTLQKGTTFRVYFPVSSAKQETQNKELTH